MIGIFEWGWYLTELTASFLIIGMIAGIVTLGVNGTFESLIDGAKAVTFGALIVGFARAIVVILEEGRVIDTVIYGLSNAVGHLPTFFAVIGMYAVQLITNFFIPSGVDKRQRRCPSWHHCPIYWDRASGGCLSIPIWRWTDEHDFPDERAFDGISRNRRHSV